jgi:hypothetical protein
MGNGLEKATESSSEIFAEIRDHIPQRVDHLRRDDKALLKDMFDNLPARVFNP